MLLAFHDSSMRELIEAAAKAICSQPAPAAASLTINRPGEHDGTLPRIGISPTPRKTISNPN
jgi:hypothetical protein